MTLEIFFSLIALAISIYLLVVFYLQSRAIQRLDDVLKKTETQCDFGKVRHGLMVELACGEIDSRSHAFLTLYGLTTFVMRNPDKYKIIAKHLRDTFGEPKKASRETEALGAEKPHWSENTKKAFEKTSWAVMKLMIRHSPIIRMLYTIVRLLKKILGLLIRRQLHLLKKAVRVFTVVSPADRAFADASYELAELAM